MSDSEIAELHRNDATLRQQCIYWSGQAKALSAETVHLGAQIAQLHTELARLRDENARLEAENQGLRRVLLVLQETQVALMRGGQGDSDELPFCDEEVEDGEQS